MLPLLIYCERQSCGYLRRVVIEDHVDARQVRDRGGGAISDFPIHSHHILSYAQNK